MPASLSTASEPPLPVAAVETANNVLHSVGNVLNTIAVSASVVRSSLASSRIGGLSKAVDMLNDHREDLPGFFANDPRADTLMVYLNELVKQIQAERQATFEELDRLISAVGHVTHVMATQQGAPGPSSLQERIDLPELLRELQHLCLPELVRHGASLELSIEEGLPTMIQDRHRMLQVLVNLVQNAAQAMASLEASKRRVSLVACAIPGAAPNEGREARQLQISVSDSGSGIAPEHLGQVFSHGFTTRADGHGFGLHSSALAASEMGGRLTAHSDGPGRGAVFTLTVPLRPA